MLHSRRILICALAACSGAPTLWARSSPPTQASTAAPAPDLSIQRELIAESNKARAAGDYHTARAMASEVVTDLLARPPAEQDAEWLALLDSAGLTAYDAQDLRTANRAWQRVLEVRAATLTEDHLDLAAVRANLAITYKALGDMQTARVLEEQVLEARSARLPDEHRDLQAARGNLAVTIKELGDFAGGRALEEQVLDVYSRTLPDDDPDLQAARQNLAITLRRLGDLHGAKALHEKVLAVCSRTLPADDPDLQSARLSLGMTLGELGDLTGARALQEQALEVYSRTLPADHHGLQAVRMNLAVTLRSLGELARARSLDEKVYEISSLTLPDDSLDLQSARLALAGTLKAMGDYRGARPLEEKALEVYSRTLPDDSAELGLARLNLAATLYALGDKDTARALSEKVLEVAERTLPFDHPSLQTARINVASILCSLGERRRAQALFEKVLEVRSAGLPDDDRRLQLARVNLAEALRELGELSRARELGEQALAAYARTLPDDHPDVQRARHNLAVTIAQGIASERGTPRDEGERTREEHAGKARCVELIADLCRAQVHAARALILGSPGREVEERSASLALQLDDALSFAQGYGVFEAIPELESRAFEFAETIRGASLASAELARRAASSREYGVLRDALRSASSELADLARRGATSEEFDRARRKREMAEREIATLARELSGGDTSGAEIEDESLARRLLSDATAVSFRRYVRSRVVAEADAEGQPAARTTSVASLCAFVVRSSESEPRAAHDAGATSDAAPSSLSTLVDLGPIEPIEAAVRAWREALGGGSDGRGLAAGAHSEPASNVHALGVALRQRVLDPLLPAIGGARRIVVVLDDALHRVPLDALPLDEERLVGDRWWIETRTTLTELSIARAPFDGPGDLVAFGDVDYRASDVGDEAKAEGAADTGATPPPDRSGSHADSRADEHGSCASILRGGPWTRGFTALPGTGVEVRGIARAFADRFGDDAAPKLLERASATRERLFELAPKARYMHVATHGWFAPESMRSWSDPEPIDELTGLGSRLSGEEHVKGMSPMLLCGLALAGANAPEDAVGRAPGLMTADEISTLDLSNCELAVLSACDTSVGEARAGQGVASLQKALQMAGARSVITSLWKVPDEATKELMLDFYRRLWVEKKPKHQALWEAKTKLREAKDERGAPKYTTRDWAAWVLTGDPR